MESTEGIIGDTNAVTKGSLAEPHHPHIAEKNRKSTEKGPGH